jgi:phosphoglucosamine mutase
VRRRFGTDGVRGRANCELTVEEVVALGRAVASTLGPEQFYLARDTRRSGALLASALAAGIAAQGSDVVDIGVAPTPVLAWVAERERRPGMVVSASHNPFPDNGVKVFAAGGVKVDDDVERAIEARWAELAEDPAALARPEGAEVGVVSLGGSALLDGYIDHLDEAVEHRRLDGLRLVLDCANGAAFELAPRAFRSLGADVVALGVEPDGCNINAGCGSTAPAILAGAVAELGADLGLAFDGDADRVIAVDASGALVDGDDLLAALVLDRAERGLLEPRAVAVTIMTNLGFHRTMEAAGIRVVSTPVGDRSILAAMVEGGIRLGGEQSGHIVVADLATTGDGVLTGALVADLVCRRGNGSASVLSGLVRRLPQLHRAIPAADPRGVAASEAVEAAIERALCSLGGRGRVLVRPSGTEPVVRVMVEAESEELAGRVLSSLAEAVEAGARRMVAAP